MAEIVSPDFSSRESGYGNTWENITSKKCFSCVKIIFIFTLFLLYNAYLVYAAFYSFNKTQSWCADIKLVIAITVCVYLIILLVQIAKIYNTSTLSGLPTFMLNRIKMHKYCRCSSSVIAIFVGMILSAVIIIDGSGNDLKLRALAGLWLIIIISFLLSKHPTQIQIRPVLWCIALEISFAMILKRHEGFINILACIIEKTGIFRQYMHVGTEILFGYLVSGNLKSSNNETLLITHNPYAFYDAPVLLFFNVIFTMMTFLKITAWIFVKIGWIFEITINTTAIESVVVITNFFWGHAKSILFVQTHLGILTKSELHTILVASFATLGPNVKILEYLENLQINETHFILANFLTLPAIVVFSKLFYPEVSVTVSKYSDISLYSDSSVSNIISMNLLMSAVKGAIFGANYVCIVCGNILGFWAMLSFFNDFIHWPLELLNWNYVTLQWIVSLPFIPLTYMTGVSFQESKIISLCAASGRLWGVNQSFTCLAKKRKEISARSFIIAIYVCGGFSGIVMTGAYLGAMAFICPTKLPEMAQLLIRAVIAGSFAVLSTAFIAGTVNLKNTITHRLKNYSIISYCIRRSINTTEFAAVISKSSKNNK
uniref:Sodium/nucleoside cotransporter n=1 Tax=Strigamia maritima TaxID=126957 RepID=T1IMK0_STRMM